MFEMFKKVSQEDKDNASKESQLYWKWFSERENYIASLFTSGGDDLYPLLGDIEKTLVKIFPKSKKPIEFGFLIEERQMDLHHQGSKYLKELMVLFEMEMPELLKKNWRLMITK